MADATYKPAVYRKQGGDDLVVASGGTLDVESGGAFKIAGTQVTSSAAELNVNYGVTAGTVTASKVVVVGANKNIDTLTIADSGLKLGSGAGTAVTATAAEINVLDAVTAGTAAASKAAVLGANKNLDTLVIADGGLCLGATAGTAVTATAAEINELDDIVASFTFAYAAGGSNVSEVTITCKDAAGATVDAARPFMVWLSDAATGVGLTGTSASGTVQAKSASGADFAALTAKKCLIVQPLATGIYILEITDSAKTAFYPCASTLDGRAFSIGAQMASGNYGA